MSIIKHVTLQKIIAHDFRYVPRVCVCVCVYIYIYIAYKVNAKQTIQESRTTCSAALMSDASTKSANSGM